MMPFTLRIASKNPSAILEALLGIGHWVRPLQQYEMIKQYFKIWPVLGLRMIFLLSKWGI